MKDILAPANRELLKQFAWSNVLLAFDFDGTLAPIVDDPAAANMRKGTRAQLHRLCALYPCAVISGRGRGDVTARLEGTGVLEVVGNHGLEPWHAPAHMLKEVAAWCAELRQKLEDLPGVEIEDKRYSLAVHYRRSRQKRTAKARIDAAAAALSGARLIGGKHVVNVLPYGAPHKGIALERIRERLGCDTALYVGDDETDEDVFALDQPGQLLGIRVGKRAQSAAAYYIRDQFRIDALLEALVDARTAARRRKRSDGEKHVLGSGR